MDQAHGFADPARFSEGFDGGHTTRNSMAVTDARFYGRGRFLSDERAATLEDQVLMPIQNSVEMGLTLRIVALTAPYVHDGRITDLAGVIEHYRRGVQPHPNLRGDPATGSAVAVRGADSRCRLFAMVSSTARWVGVVVALAVAAVGCRSKDRRSSEAADAAQPTEKRGYLDRGLSASKRVLSSGKQRGESALAAGKKLAAEGKQLGTSAYRQTRRWSEASIEDVQAEAVAIVERGGGDLAVAAGQVNQLLGSLASDTDGKASTADKVARMMVLMVPVVGPTKRYLDARALYQAGHADHDQARIQQARRETLIAFVEAGLDIGMLGLVGNKIDMVATGADKVLKAFRAARVVSTLVGTNLKTFDRLLDTMLEHDDIRDAVDAALTVDLADITPAR